MSCGLDDESHYSKDIFAQILYDVTNNTHTSTYRYSELLQTVVYNLVNSQS